MNRDDGRRTIQFALPIADGCDPYFTVPDREIAPLEETYKGIFSFLGIGHDLLGVVIDDLQAVFLGIGDFVPSEVYLFLQDRRHNQRHFQHVIGRRCGYGIMIGQACIGLNRDIVLAAVTESIIERSPIPFVPFGNVVVQDFHGIRRDVGKSFPYDLILCEFDLRPPHVRHKQALALLTVQIDVIPFRMPFRHHFNAEFRIILVGEKLLREKFVS